MASKRMAGRGFDINKKERSMVATLDDLSELEAFKEAVLPVLRQELKRGMTANQLREKYKAHAQARIISQALTDISAVGLAAAKDMLDRQDGRAKEIKEVEHRFAKLSDDQLRAIILSEQAEALLEDETDTNVVVKE